MESRFYYFSGQTPENTKVVDRHHALHITRDNWNRITGHLERKKLIQEQLDKDAAHVKALKDGSEEMTRKWDNSVENIRRRKEEDRLNKIKELEENKFKGFYKLRVEQEAKRSKFVEETNAKMYASAGYPRQINYALLECEVWKERDKQVELNKIIKEQERLDYLEAGEMLRQRDVITNKEDAEKARAAREKKTASSEECKQMVQNAEAQKEKDKLERYKHEQGVNEAAAKEMEEIKEVIKKEKIRKQNFMKNVMARDRQEKALIAERHAIEEKEIGEVNQIYNDAKLRISCIMRRKEEELREVLRKKNEKAIENLKRINDEDQDEFMTKWLDPPIIMLEETEARKQKRRDLIQQRIDDHEKWKIENEEVKRKEAEIRKWETLNRFKTEEIVEKYKKKLKEKDIKGMQKYKEELFEQMRYLKETKAHEKEELYRAVTFDKADEKFFKYVKETEQIAKDKGLTTYPIKRVIKTYIKENELYLKNKKMQGENNTSTAGNNIYCKCRKKEKEKKK